MKDSTNKIKILKTLLESPKTTGEIAIKLDYIDEKGYGRYNVIESDLNTLEQYGFIHRIEEKKKRPGAPATTYDIVYEYSVLRDIVKEYSPLISDLQKSDKIISMLAEMLERNPDTVECKDKILIMLEHSPTVFITFLNNFLIDYKPPITLRIKDDPEPSGKIQIGENLIKEMEYHFFKDFEHNKALYLTSEFLEKIKKLFNLEKSSVKNIPGLKPEYYFEYHFELPFHFYFKSLLGDAQDKWYCYSRDPEDGLQRDEK